jgi:hypothetical protein
MASRRTPSEKVPSITVSPITLVCPQCGAKAGEACEMLRGEVDLLHIDRIRAAARAEVRAKKADKKKS